MLPEGPTYSARHSAYSALTLSKPCELSLWLLYEAQQSASRYKPWESTL